QPGKLLPARPVELLAPAGGARAAPLLEEERDAVVATGIAYVACPGDARGMWGPVRERAIAVEHHQAALLADVGLEQVQAALPPVDRPLDSVASDPVIAAGDEGADVHWNERRL